MKNFENQNAYQKSKIALEAIKGEKTIAQIATEHEVSPSLVEQWMEKAINQLPYVFMDEKEKAQELICKTKSISKRLYDKGCETFGSPFTFATWMQTYSPVFEAKPVDLIVTEEGIQEIINELCRIKHGIFA